MLSVEDLEALLPLPPVYLLTETYGVPSLDVALLHQLFASLSSASPAELLAHQDQAIEEYTGVRFDRSQDASDPSDVFSSFGSALSAAMPTAVGLFSGPGSSSAAGAAGTMRMPVLKPSHYSLFFLSDPTVGEAQPHVSLSEEVMLFNKTKRNMKFFVSRFTAVAAKTALGSRDLAVEISPPSAATAEGLVVKQGRREKLRIVVTPMKSGLLEDMLILTLDNDIRLYLLIRLNVRHRVFGMYPELMPQILVPLPSADTPDAEFFSIPVVLAEIVERYFSQSEHLVEGTFRCACQADMLTATQSRMDERAQIDWSQLHAQDPHLQSALLRLFFRSLPDPLLGTLSHLNIASVDALSVRPGSLLAFLIALLAKVSAFSKFNRMGPKAMAIVWAPNLYRVAEGGDATLELVAVEKVCAFIEREVSRYMDAHSEELRSLAATAASALTADTANAVRTANSNAATAGPGAANVDEASTLALSNAESPPPDAA